MLTKKVGFFFLQKLHTLDFSFMVDMHEECRLLLTESTKSVNISPTFKRLSSYTTIYHHTWKIFDSLST